MDDQDKAKLDKIRKSYVIKQKTLILSTRGITFRYRHLMKDLLDLLPHAKKDSKLDTKQALWVLNEVCDMKGCNNCIFFEVRKGTDLFLWMAKVPHGPSIKFHILNVHTMDELNFTGNSLKGSRPLLSFDAGFDATPHHALMKELLTQIFGTPKGHPKSKPFIDHVISFSLIDNKIWFRNFQILEEPVEGTKKTETTLVEIGPRFVMNPVKILSGSFSGATLWDNPNYFTPNTLRAFEKHKEATKYIERLRGNKKYETKLEQNVIPTDELADVFDDNGSFELEEGDE